MALRTAGLSGAARRRFKSRPGDDAIGAERLADSGRERPARTREVGAPGAEQDPYRAYSLRPRGFSATQHEPTYHPGGRRVDVGKPETNALRLHPHGQRPRRTALSPGRRRGQGVPWIPQSQQRFPGDGRRDLLQSPGHVDRPVRRAGGYGILPGAGKPQIHRTRARRLDGRAQSARFDHHSVESGRRGHFLHAAPAQRQSLDAGLSPSEHIPALRLQLVLRLAPPVSAGRSPRQTVR